MGELVRFEQIWLRKHYAPGGTRNGVGTFSLYEDGTGPLVRWRSIERYDAAGKLESTVFFVESSGGVVLAETLTIHEKGNWAFEKRGKLLKTGALVTQ